MFLVRRVVGHSMQPSLRPNQLVVFRKSRQLKKNQIVLGRYKQLEIVKRIVNVNTFDVCLRGDNHHQTYWLDQKAVKAVFWFKLGR